MLAQLKYVRPLLLHPSFRKMDPFPYPDGWYADWYFVCHRNTASTLRALLPGPES